MVGSSPVRDVTVFVSLYLVLSLPPFLYLHRELSSGVANLAVAASVGTAGLVAVAGLFLASEGVGRYTEFLFGVSDLFSVVVDLSFLLAAVSWWLVPELAARFAWGSELRYVLVGIIACQLPMVVFLSLMTVVGRAQKPT